ncbi:MAG: lytic transglycosylase domain-containing protein [Cardiobacteriaceae bacterium]|nr:lytic transglycosylase domain-containing protein [Cardiobacteriaceae bacterium]
MEKPYHKAGSFTLYLLLALTSIAARAQDATSGLYICPAAGGMSNIVSQPTSSDCRPYQKGMLNNNVPTTSAISSTTPSAPVAINNASTTAFSTPATAPLPNAAFPAAASSAPVTNNSGYEWDETPDDAPSPATKTTVPSSSPKKRVTNANNNGGYEWDENADDDNTATAPISPNTNKQSQTQPLNKTEPKVSDKKTAQEKKNPESKAPDKNNKDNKTEKTAASENLTPVTANARFPAAPNFDSDPKGSGKFYSDIAIRAGKESSSSQSTTTTPPVAASTTPSGLQIWMCPQLDGTPVIIETATAPQGNCQPLGKKGGSGTAAPTPQPNRGKPLVNNQEKNTANEQHVAQDIYKCFDSGGRPSFVPADQRGQYRHCTFFSRSYSGAKQDFVQNATQKQQIEALATAGIQKNKTQTGGPGLQCIGAGEISFNGEKREFNCATRSFDYTPGTSGGEARLGNQQTSIAAHNLDYLNTSGSCGGTVTSENGRVFHLEPTKDCPQTFIIEAQRIAAQIRNELNINVSGAFRERQRNLSAQINQIANEIGVEAQFVHAIISAESAYKPGARSHVGAMGLMQLMPATARRFGVSDGYNTGQNIRGGTTYLKWLLNEFGGDMQLAAAGYNAGEGNVRKYGNKIPPFIETRAYVPKVMEYYRRYKANPSEIGL